MSPEWSCLVLVKLIHIIIIIGNICTFYGEYSGGDLLEKKRREKERVESTGSFDRFYIIDFDTDRGSKWFLIREKNSRKLEDD